MEANRQHLYQGQAFERYPVGVMQMTRGEVDIRTHPAIHVDAEHFEVCAAVRPSAPTGATDSTLQIRTHRYVVPYCEAADTRSELMDGDGEFVPEDTGIAEKWLFAGECMQIGAAYADTTYTYLHPARLRRIGQ
jgi:hypothetical protein